MKFIALLVVTFFAAASAGCDNQCSGHGTCGLHGVCDCYDNWGMNMARDSGDCSERTCPFEFAWVDKPDKEGRHHARYTECASRGVCNRNTGLCECFPGYEGKGCQRTACPNDCSGHGVCSYIEDFGFESTRYEWTNAKLHDSYSTDLINFAYHGWDEKKTRGCKCDPEWGDSDCSKRMCPYGNDVMDRRSDISDAVVYQTQQILFTSSTYNSGGSGDALGKCNGLNDKTFSIGFTSKRNETFWTAGIEFVSSATLADCNALTAGVKKELLRLPNRVVDDVVVSADCGVDSGLSGNVVSCLTLLNITFVGEAVQGRQNLLDVNVRTCKEGCYPAIDGLELTPQLLEVKELFVADYNSYECGNRGVCDYDSGVCECYEGYTGDHCQTMTALI